MALAVNSSPSHHLQNTCSGIVGTRSFRTLVRVIATPSRGEEHDYLELLFGEEGEGRVQGTKIRVNEEYGRLPESSND